MYDRKLELKDTSLTYKKSFRWNELAYEAIERAYLRVEAVNARMCCGVANFDMHFLMLKQKDGKLAKIQFERGETVEEILAKISEKNDKIIIGFNKNATA